MLTHATMMPSLFRRPCSGAEYEPHVLGASLGDEAGHDRRQWHGGGQRIDRSGVDNGQVLVGAAPPWPVQTNTSVKAKARVYSLFF